MDIVKTATDWAKAEMFSTTFFIIAGLVFVAASIGLWQLGRSDLARAYIIPMSVAGAMLMTIGFGLFFTNKARAANFPIAYQEDPAAFVQSEISRVDDTLHEYQTVVFKAIPIIIIIAAVLIISLSSPLWRAISITSITMLIVIMLIDGMAHARIENYRTQLELVKE